MITKARFEQGMTASEYLDRMTMNKDRFLRALDGVAVGAGDARVLGATRNVVVITEDWCGTSLAVLPYVFKVVEASPGVALRVFLRDENPDVMDQFLKDGRYRSVPVVVFLDERFTELARFIERRPA